MKLLTQKLQQEYDEDEFSQSEPKYWGSEAAGCIFIAKDTGRILIAKRSSEEDPGYGVNEPGTWGTWGGKMDWGENPKDAVVREVEEEVGYDGEYKLAFLWTYQDPEEGFEYHNFLALVPTEFKPKLNWENEGSKWVEFGEWPNPMHFGLKALIQNAGEKIHRVIILIKRKQADILEGMDVPPPAIIQKVQTNAPASPSQNITNAYIVATTLWGEARGEGSKGMQAVMNVIMNRGKQDFNKARSICLQPKQFSMWNKIANPERIAFNVASKYRDDKIWKEAVKIVDLAMKGKLPDITNGATFYFNPKKANPKWAKKMIKTASIGRHDFYKPMPRVQTKTKTPLKEAVKEALESQDKNSAAIIKKGLVGVGIYEYELRSPFSFIRYRYEPDAKLFYLDSIVTPVENQGKGYARSLLESFFRLIKSYGGTLDCDTYTTSGANKIKHIVEYFAKKYGIRVLRGTEEETIQENVINGDGFKNWFGNSVVKNSDGTPKVVYHGTNQPIKSFSKSRRGLMTHAQSAKKAFYFTDSSEVAHQYAITAGQRLVADIDKYEKKTEYLKQKVEDLERKAKITGNWKPYEKAMEEWENYEIESSRGDQLHGQNIIPVFLKIENPFVYDFENASPNVGIIDAIVTKALGQGNDGVIFLNIEDPFPSSNHYIVFNPSQIKSAIGNTGKFSKKSSDITKENQTSSPANSREKKIKEGTISKDAVVVLGTVFPDGEIRAIVGEYDGAMHPSNWSGNKWRYVPEFELLNWWEQPSEKEDSAVKKYLAKYGLDVKMVNVYTAIKWNPKPAPGEVVAEKLVMEAQRATPKQLVEFLRAQIKGTEWDGKVFAVGGFVRDLLLGKEPKDLDVVVSVNQGGKLFTDWLGKKLGIYKEGSNPVIFPTFGTANLRLDGVVWNGIDFSGENIDAVMFRKEQYHDPNSRKPVVQFTPHIEIDAQRRDITFNSLYLNIASGEILDPTGVGKEDLKNGIIRTAIDPTIIYTDDALRMFRAVRFAAQFGFKLAPEIVDGIKKNLHRLGNTSRERVAVELNKILTSKNADYGLRLLRDTGLLAHIGPELQQMVGMTQNVHHKDDVFDHTLSVIMGTQPELLNRLIALFHDIGKITTRAVTPKGVQFIGHENAGPDIVEKIMMSLKYPRVMIDAVKLGVRHHMKLKHGGPDAVNLSDKTLRKFKIALGQYLEQLLDVMHADNISHADASAMPKQIEAVRARLKALDIQVTKPVLPINGNDLLAIGVKAGPMMGKILNAVTEKWYENPNVSKQEAMHIAKSILNGKT